MCEAIAIWLQTSNNMMYRLCSIALLAFVVATTAEFTITLDEDGTEFVTTGLQEPSESLERVINGHSARPNQFPWQAKVLVQRVQGRWDFFSGALIAPKWVVTLGSAVRGSRETRVVLGSNSFARGRQIFSTQVIPHPQYQRNRHRLFNIAVICLHEAVKPSPNLRPITLPPRELMRTQFSGHRVRVSGFGSTSKCNSLLHSSLILTSFHFKISEHARPFNTLQWADLRVTSTSTCRQHFSNSIGNLLLCAANTDRNSARPGFGDIGSPLTWRHNDTSYLIGLTTAYATRKSQSADIFGFLNVALHADWLRRFND